jgi:lipopolysaccharide transport system ATP-binding protein
MDAITVAGLGKAYKQYPSRWSRLAEWVDPRRRARHTLRWVLRDVAFSVAPGESIGIIGVNGAGKSTLLKMITGTVQPTVGQVRVAGRIAALLELGMGFHPDFTGRQNAIMSGQLLGFSVDEIQRLMPQIEAFAEIGDYIDQPVRVYSSGMQVRLAFAVAVARRPDILIVDEALAVGDVYFQQKCYQRIREFIDQGTTLLFVTHGMSTVLEICTRTLYLRNGRLVFDGLPKQAVDLYQADLLIAQDQGEVEPVMPERAGAMGNLASDSVSCLDCALFDAREKPTQVVISESPVELRIGYRVHRTLSDPHVGFKIRNRLGSVIFETNTYCMRQPIGPAAAGNELWVSFRMPIDLAPGDYTITIGLANEGSGAGQFRESLSYLHEIESFKVLPNPDAIIWDGMINIHPTVRARQVPADGTTAST